MRLYSRGQLITAVMVTAVTLFALFLGFELIFRKDAGEVAVTAPVVPEVLTAADSGYLQPVVHSGDERENIDIYEGLNRGVVNITTETIGMNWFLEPVPMEGGSGSGSIIDKDGYILTNHHVIQNASRLYVTLYDGDQYEALVVGKDPENDLAVIKIDVTGKDLTVIPFGSSESLKVGQKVLAIGNPFGYDRTLTTGIVSGLGRPVKTRNNLIIQDMIQTDASINPGNSGGPLLDSNGRMIGVNTMIYSPSGGSVGIGFAVPVDTARRVVPDLIRYGMVKRGWIDIVPVQLDRNIVRYGQMSVSEGILVSKVVPRGNAEKAGIKGGDPNKPVRYGRYTIYLGGDIIVGVDGNPVATLADLFGALEDNAPGEEVSLTYIRGKREITTTITLSERPEGLLLE